MVFLQPIIDVAIYYATGRSPRTLEKEKYGKLHTIIEEFILGNNVSKIESTMQLIIDEGFDPKCIPKIYKILQVRPSSELEENPAKVNTSETTSDTQTNHRHRSAPWSTDEDERLIAGIFHYGFSDWQKVSAFVGKGRTRSQCGQRWLRCLDPNMNKEKWSPEEDANLKHLVDLYGVHSWARIAKELGNRTDVQCRYRYVRCAKEVQNYGGPANNNFQSAQDFMKVQNQSLLASIQPMQQTMQQTVSQKVQKMGQNQNQSQQQQQQQQGQTPIIIPYEMSTVEQNDQAINYTRIMPLITPQIAPPTAAQSK